jgi:hypothetical protein
MRAKTRKQNRRQFLHQMATGAGLALAGSAVPAWAQQGLKSKTPTPQSLTYLDRRLYIRNMERKFSPIFCREKFAPTRCS